MTCSPSLADSPSCSATMNPAEFIAGTAPTFTVVSSGGPKFVGRLPSSPMPPMAEVDEGEEEEEQPAASPANTVSAAAHAAVRPHLRMPVNKHLTELAADHVCPGRINQYLITRSSIYEKSGQL